MSAYCEFGVAATLVSSTIPNDIGFIQFCGVFWTLVQFSFNAVFTIGAVYTQRLSLILLAISGYLGSGINEWVIKRIVDEPRPYGTCLTSDGFPSGHAVQSVTFCTWIILETIFHPGWNLRKRLTIIIAALIIFVPTGPCRHILNDHSWKQILWGMGIGLAWGSIFWLLCNFILFRYLYVVMSWRITQFFHIRNDCRPHFERSPYEGKIVEKKPVWTDRFDTKKVRRSFAREPKVINTVHIITITAGIAIGIIGIALSFVKDQRDPQCDRVAPNVMLVCGILTVITYLLWIPITISIHRKLTDRDWYPEVVQGLLFSSLFLICQSSFWAIIVKYAASQDCPSSGPDVAVIFLVIYFIWTGAILVFLSVMFWVVDLRRLYGFKKRRPSGTEVNQDEIRHAKSVPHLSDNKVEKDAEEGLTTPKVAA